MSHWNNNTSGWDQPRSFQVPDMNILRQQAFSMADDYGYQSATASYWNTDAQSPMDSSSYGYGSGSGGEPMSANPSTSSYSSYSSNSSYQSPVSTQYPYNTPRGGQSTASTATQALPNAPHHPSVTKQKSPSSSEGKATDKTYFCLVRGCGKETKRAACMKRHTNSVHFSDIAERYDCNWGGCNRTGANGFTRSDKMIEHMRDVHHYDWPKRHHGRQESDAITQHR